MIRELKDMPRAPVAPGSLWLTERAATNAVESARRKLDVERSTLRGEHEKAFTSQGQMVEEARRQLEEERKKNAELLTAEQNRLMEKERNAGVLEGQVTTLTAEATSLRERVNEMYVRQREAEVQAGRHRQESDRIFSELGKARDQLQTTRRQTEEKLKEQRREHERRLAEELQQLRKKSKIGCGGFKKKPKTARGAAPTAK